MSLSYVTLGTNDPAKAKPFYAALMEPLGGIMAADYEGFTFCYELPNGDKIGSHGRRTSWKRPSAMA